MSSPIENAAREIVVELLGQEYATRRAVPITAAIIRRHLFPLVKPEWSTTTVMTMSFMEGVKISKKDALAKLDANPERLLN